MLTRHLGLRLALLVVLGLALATAPALAEAGDFQVRTRLILIEPDDSASGDVSEAEVESDVTVEVDATYFFTDNIALEGILATATQEVTLNGDSLGSIHHAPATFLLQWHFMPGNTTRPYVGIGLNTTIFYGESGALQNDLEIDSSSVGYALQVGSDFDINDDVFFNIDLKYAEIETDVKLDGDNLGTVEVNPFVLGFGIGYRF